MKLLHYIFLILMSVLSLKPSFFPTWTGKYTSDTNIAFRQPSDLWGGSQHIVPKPTNRWFTTLAIYRSDEPTKTFHVNTFPYLVNLTDQGIEMCYPNKIVVDDNINPHSHVLTTFEKNFSFQSVEDLVGKRHIVSSVVDEPFSVSFAWGDDKCGFIAPLVHGMAYVTFELNNITPKFTTIHALLDINGKGETGTQTSQKFKISLNNGQTWFIYASEPLTLSWSQSGIVANKAFSGVIRVAEQKISGSGSVAESVLDAHKNVYPVGGTVDFTVSGNMANIDFNWKVKGAGELLMLCLPHHRATLVGATFVKDFSYDTIRGKAVGIIGNTWSMKETLPTTSWNSDQKIHPDAISFIKKAVQIEQSFVPTASDSYSFGKELAKLIRIALIAYQVDEKESAIEVLKTFKKSLQPWIEKNNKDPLFYDAVWGGVCTKDGLQNSGADYGLGWYNDHHFHYGYFIYSAAVFIHLVNELSLYALYGDFIKSMDPFVQDLIKDIANSKADTSFPDYRFMDWYLGHTLASGLFPFGDGKNQESTSEAVNAWYGISLYGMAMGNKEIEDKGRVLTATEIRGAKTYWHMHPGNTQIYPASFTDYACVGILWEDKADYATWFGVNPEFIHMIQFLPFTPITDVLISRSWNKVQYDQVKKVLTSKKLMEEWRGYLLMSQAMTYPQDAWKNIQYLTKYDNGNSMSNVLYWVATRPGLPTRLPAIAVGHTIFDNNQAALPSSGMASEKQKEDLLYSLFTPGFLKTYTNRTDALAAFNTFLTNNKLKADTTAMAVFDHYYPIASPATKAAISKTTNTKQSSAQSVRQKRQAQETALMNSLFTKDFLKNYKDRDMALTAYKQFLKGVGLKFDEEAYAIFKKYYPKGSDRKADKDHEGELPAIQKTNIREIAKVNLMKSLFTKEFLQAYDNRANALKAYNEFLKDNELTLDDQAMKVFDLYYSQKPIADNEPQDKELQHKKEVTSKLDNTQAEHRDRLMKSLFRPQFLKVYTNRDNALVAYKDFLHNVGIPDDATSMAVFDQYYPA